MRGVNKVILVGNLGADPDTRYTGGGKAVTNIRIATSESWTDKEGEKQERTEWHSIVMFGKLAEIAGEYCEKGRQVYIEGKLVTEKWTDKEGVERYTTKIYAETMQLLGGGGSSRSDDRGGYGQREQAQRQGGGGNRSRGEDQGDYGSTRGNSNARERAAAAAAAGAQDRPPARQEDAFDDDSIPF